MRILILTPLLISLGLAPAKAQDGVGTVALVGYGALSIAALASLATRNTPPEVSVGSQVKVRLRGFADWSNAMSITHIDADSMFVSGDSVDWRFARSEIESLRVKASTGRWAEGWAIGLLVGGGGGALLGYTAVASDPGGDDWFTPGESAAIVGVVLGVAGSTVGAGLGLLAPSRWVTIGNPKGSRVSIVPTFTRPGFVARVRF